MLDLWGWWQSVGDRRRNFRRLARDYASIDLGNGSVPRGCMIADISEGGARLAIAHCDDLPNEFTLLVPRRCRIVRRMIGQIGVQFIDGEPV
jgi:hypothetical protein